MITEEVDVSCMSEEEFKDYMKKEHPNEWDDVYHLGCASFPNCELEGCGEHGAG